MTKYDAVNFANHKTSQLTNFFFENKYLQNHFIQNKRMIFPSSLFQICSDFTFGLFIFAELYRKLDIIVTFVSKNVVTFRHEFQ